MLIKLLDTGSPQKRKVLTPYARILLMAIKGMSKDQAIPYYELFLVIQPSNNTQLDHLSESINSLIKNGFIELKL
jgi:hypothetical protein